MIHDKTLPRAEETFLTGFTKASQHPEYTKDTLGTYKQLERTGNLALGKNNVRKENQWSEAQKNPRVFPEDAVFHPVAMLPIREERDAIVLMGRSSGFRFVLLAALPIIRVTVVLRLSSPVTAAGPQRICTVFPKILISG